MSISTTFFAFPCFECLNLKTIFRPNWKSNYNVDSCLSIFNLTVIGLVHVTISSPVEPNATAIDDKPKDNNTTSDISQTIVEMVDSHRIPGKPAWFEF